MKKNDGIFDIRYAKSTYWTNLSSNLCRRKKYIRLWYCPREPAMINIDTSNKLNLNIHNKKRKEIVDENKEPFGI